MTTCLFIKRYLINTSIFNFDKTLHLYKCHSIFSVQYMEIIYIYIYIYIYIICVGSYSGLVSSVGIATGYRLDGPGI